MSKLVMIDWIDSTEHGGWRDKKDFLKTPAILCRTIGYLVGNDKESFKIAATTSGDEWLNRQSIPKGCVIRKQVLDIVLPKLKRDKG